MDGVTSIARYLHAGMILEFDIHNPIEVIPNFVNCDLYRRDPKAAEHRAQFAKPDERLLVHLSNFRPVKRLQDVVEIFDRVQKKVPSRLLMIGDGPDPSVAEWMETQKRILARVIFLGKHDHVQKKPASPHPIAI